MYKVLVCVGTRPNFIKVTQFEKAFKAYPNVKYILLHTGQHYDQKMNDVFFTELGIQAPDITFKLDGGGQIDVITQIMTKIEKALIEIKPDLVMVPGDVNSSFACAFVANRMQIPVAHIESGLRSYDMTMPEEVNRILIDHISAIHFVTEPSGLTNLAKEGKDGESVKMVGNTMIDSLVAFQSHIDASGIKEQLGLKSKYAVMTFHRPANVDDPTNLGKVCDLIERLSKLQEVVFPIHPRTVQNLKKYGYYEKIASLSGVRICEPLGYLDFLHLLKYSSVVVTDSGGVQEETTFLGVPCLTIRSSTERPVTVDVGTNIMMKFDNDAILKEVEKIAAGEFKKGQIPDKWDGKSSERIAEAVSEFLEKKAKAQL